MNIRRFFRVQSVMASMSVLVLAACGAPPAATETAAPAVPAATDTAMPAASPTAASSPTATALPGVQVLPVSSLGTSIPWLPMPPVDKPMSVYYGFNFETPPFDSALVRKAFAAAVDREQVALEAEGFKFREVRPATTMVPSQTLGRDLYGEVGTPFNAEQAAAWLAEAGYTDTSAFPPVTLLVYMRGQAAPGAHFRLAETITDMWEQYLGVKVSIETLEHPSGIAARFGSNPPQIYLLAWVGDVNDPDNYLRYLLHSGSEFNNGHFANARFDELVDRAAGISGPAERQRLYIEAERILTEEEVGIVPLFHTLRYTQP